MKIQIYKNIFYVMLVSGIISACVHLTHIALINIRNNTNNEVKVNSRFAEQDSFSEVFTLKPNTSDVFMKYEETPGDEEEVFDSFGELQLIDESGCTVQIDRKQIREFSKRDPDRAHWIIHIDPVLFEQAGCAK